MLKLTLQRNIAISTLTNPHLISPLSLFRHSASLNSTCTTIKSSSKSFSTLPRPSTSANSLFSNQSHSLSSRRFTHQSTSYNTNRTTKRTFSTTSEPTQPLPPTTTKATTTNSTITGSQTAHKIDPYQPNSHRLDNSTLPDHRPIETPDERRFRLRNTPLARGKSSRYITDINSIPDASEAMIEEIISNPSKLSVKDVILTAEKRVEDNQKARLKIANQLPWFFGAIAILAYLIPNHARQSKEDQEFSLEHQIKLFPTFQDILDTSFHTHLDSALPVLLETFFDSRPEQLTIQALETMEKAKTEYGHALALTDEEMLTKFDSSSALSLGVASMRFFPESPIYAQHDSQLGPEEDPDRYITLQLSNAHTFLRLYMYMLIMHLEQKMTEPVFVYLKEHPELNSTFTTAKNAMWETMQCSVLSHDKKILTMLHAEAGYESVKFHRDESFEATQQVSLRGLKRVLSTLHFSIWCELKAGMIMRILDKHKQYIKSSKIENEFIDEAIQQEQYVKLFKIMNPLLADPNCVLKFPTEQHENHFYNTQALIDEVSMSSKDPLTLAMLYKDSMVEILDQGEFEHPDVTEKRRAAREMFQNQQMSLVLHGIISSQQFFDPTDPVRRLPKAPTLDRLYQIITTNHGELSAV